MHYYILSGLGADERVFGRLKFPKPYTHLYWIMNRPTESLSMYAKRMAKPIVDPENSVLIGLSFGGIMAQEVAAQLNIPKLVLINTVKNRREIPWYLRVVGNLGLHKLFPFLYTRPNLEIANYLFGLQNREEKHLMYTIIKETEEDYLKWAVDKILKWYGVNHQAKVMQIHARNDRIFPIRNIQADKIISGGHFAVYSRANEAQKALALIL